MTATDPTPWTKASRSGGNGSCVQLRTREGDVEVRDGKAREASPIPRFTPAEFAAGTCPTRRPGSVLASSTVRLPCRRQPAEFR